MRAISPAADPQSRIPDVPPSRIPRHIAIIMDGNGRWAKERGLPRMAGHRAGADSVREIVEECGGLGVEAITLYSFSMENWKRPREEVDALMQLYLIYMARERESLVENNIRFRQIGRRDGLPAECLEALDLTLEATRGCTGPTLCLAVNYGARAELIDAARRLADDAKAGRIDPDDIDEAAFASRLTTAGLPDPDLLIRTAGERRLSNFLLWQVSYAELHIAEERWPEFGAAQLHDAIRSYASRSRRFGGLDPAPGVDGDA